MNQDVVKLGAFILLAIGTLGLMINEFIFNWGTTITLAFAALNVVGLAVLIYMYWGMKKEVSSQMTGAKVLRENTRYARINSNYIIL